MKTKEDPNELEKKLESMSEKLAKLSDDELDQVNGVISDGEMFYIGSYICPFCKNEHEARLRPDYGRGYAERLSPETIPCGKGQLDGFIVSFGPENIEARLLKKGILYLADVKLIGGGIYNEYEFYF